MMPPTAKEMSSCRHIRSVAYLNQEASAFLVSGDLDTAINIYFHALEMLGQARAFDNAPEIALSCWNQSFPFDRRVLRPQSLQARDLLAKNTNDDGSYFVYANPLVFPPDIALNPDCAINCSAVVLFNLALAFHQRGRLADSCALLRRVCAPFSF